MHVYNYFSQVENYLKNEPLSGAKTFSDVLKQVNEIFLITTFSIF